MDRRTFTHSLAALFAVPVMPLAGAATPVAAVASVPSQARFWAIYMSGLHGTCTPRALQVMLNIPAAQAQSYLSQLVAQGVIKPSSISTGLKARAVVSKKSEVLTCVKEKILDDPATAVVRDDVVEPHEELLTDPPEVAVIDEDTANEAPEKSVE